MKKYIKHLFLFAAITTLMSGCDTEKEFDIPEIKEVLLFESFEATASGSGSIEVPITVDGWANYNVSATGTRLWHSRTFSSNKYAEFSSNFSAAGTTDQVWLVTPEKTLSAEKSVSLSFDTKVRFWTSSTGSLLKVFISENYDGTKAGIATATWTELNPTLPTSAQIDVFIKSGNIDLSAYKGKKVRIAFKYTGDKAANTTTYQLDNIKLFETE
jgi:hypothetical protein